MLKEKHIKRLYVTEFRRTQNTADSLSTQSGIDTVHCLADTSGIDLLIKIKAIGDNRNAILIIGHRNTLPVIIRKLGTTGYPAVDMPSNEYDNLFLVQFIKGIPSLLKAKYGAKSGSSATMK